MSIYPKSIEKLIRHLVRFPGIGRRSAERIVSYILHAKYDEIESLAQSIREVKKTTRLCSICYNLSESETCAICQDQKREASVLCVVENPQDVIAIEKSQTFHGLYHVLGGAISPLEGKGHKELEIESLLSRIKQGGISEIILAMDADVEGEATALYLNKLIRPTQVKLTRIGVGIPSGANLEYADSSTIASALEGRRAIQ
ncbi:MAG: recombination mediator RecR [Candidatus Omnitrophica bacterium]|nr:recombination mediator RecR [Candidatus Omnitrophota bacterium]MBU1871304.1 recombination mediator RecR [Candidatus Omnitrophota bacterium]